MAAKYVIIERGKSAVYCTGVPETAKYLGVSEKTIRRWFDNDWMYRCTDYEVYKSESVDEFDEGYRERDLGNQGHLFDLEDEV